MGTYAFSVEKNKDESLSYETIPLLTLTYATDENGKFADAATPPTNHKFNILGSNNMAYNITRMYLNVDWKNAIENAKARSDYRPNGVLKMQEIDSQYTISGYLDLASQIPENILE